MQFNDLESHPSFATYCSVETQGFSTILCKEGILMISQMAGWIRNHSTGLMVGLEIMFINTLSSRQKAPRNFPSLPHLSLLFGASILVLSWYFLPFRHPSKTCPPTFKTIPQIVLISGHNTAQLSRSAPRTTDIPSPANQSELWELQLCL